MLTHDMAVYMVLFSALGVMVWLINLTGTIHDLIRYIDKIDIDKRLRRLEKGKRGNDEKRTINNDAGDV